MLEIVLVDSDAPQSRLPLLIISWLTPTIASATVRNGEVERSAVVQGVDGVRTEGTVLIPSGRDDVPLAVLSRSLRSK